MATSFPSMGAARSSRGGGRGRGRGGGRGRGRGGNVTWGARHSGLSGAGTVQGPAATTTAGLGADAPSISTADRAKIVHLDGVAAMKIVKHCSESLPTFVAGSLLGLDVDNRLEVTNCFPFPSASAAAAAADEDIDPQLDMLKALREVNVDNNQVGWYQSTYLGSYCTRDLILTQFDFQENLGPNTVVIVYDPVRSSSSGTLTIKALRLTETFMEAYRNKTITAEAAAAVPLSSGKVFEELPVRIHNSALVQALLADLEVKAKRTALNVAAAPDSSESLQRQQQRREQVDRSLLYSDFERLDLATTPFLEKNLQFLGDQIEELAYAQNGLTGYQRRAATNKKLQEEWIAQRREENKAREAEGLEPLPLEDPTLPFFRQLHAPSQDRLETLLMSAQVGQYCDQINQFAGQSFGKLFLARELHAPHE